jgi:hypothetical protein
MDEQKRTSVGPQKSTSAKKNYEGHVNRWSKAGAAPPATTNEKVLAPQNSEK